MYACCEFVECDCPLLSLLGRSDGYADAEVFTAIYEENFEDRLQLILAV